MTPLTCYNRSFSCFRLGAHSADVRPRPGVGAGSGRGRDGQRPLRGKRQTGTQSHVDPNARPAGPERRLREVLRQQADGRAEPEQDHPQRQRTVQVRGQQRRRSHRANGQRGGAHQTGDTGRD